MVVLSFEDISKVFRSSMTGRHIYTLGPVSFGVRQGEIFGYLGPNGAGKTTTIKLALGLLRASTGKVTCFGRPSTCPEVRSRMGFLPEQPYFYQHLSAIELLEFYGSVCGITGKQLRRRAEKLLEITGLAQFRTTSLSKFSKGMLQRIGLAQALVNDPDIVILDEPLAGLDPVGRREIRDLILELKALGKTVFFSSHILQDVEMICDRVGVLSNGKVSKVTTIAEVLHDSVKCVEMLFDSPDLEKITRLGLGDLSRRGEKTVLSLSPDADINRAVSILIASGCKLSAVIPQRQTLEDYFVSEVRGPRYWPKELEAQVQSVLHKAE